MKIILALLMTFTSIIAHSESEMLRLMRLSCESSKSARACYNYANLLHRRQKTQEARIYFKKGCQKGYAPSCNQITSEKLINATFVKAKKKKKVVSKKLSDFEIEAIKELQKDQELSSILSNYCTNKKLEEACQIKKCIIDEPFSPACRKHTVEDGLKKIAPEQKKIVEEITERDKDKIKAMPKKQRTFYVLEEAQKLSLKRLAKECDNGRLKSCFAYEYSDYITSKMKKQVSDFEANINRQKASQD